LLLQVRWLVERQRPRLQLRPGTPRVPIVPLPSFMISEWREILQLSNPYAIWAARPWHLRRDLLLAMRRGLRRNRRCYKEESGAHPVIDDAITVGALAREFRWLAAIPGTDVFGVFPLEQDNEFGGRRLKENLPPLDLDLPQDGKGVVRLGTSTTMR